MNYVQPIRDKKKIEEMKEELRKKWNKEIIYYLFLELTQD